MGKIAVIDTETNWVDQVMSIGTVLADSETFRPLDARYYLFPAECQIGGMYEKALCLPTPAAPISLPREKAMADIALWLRKQRVQAIFAYITPDLTKIIFRSFRAFPGTISWPWPPTASTIPNCHPTGIIAPPGG